jgi:hypothetical protein
MPLGTAGCGEKPFAADELVAAIPNALLNAG